MVDESAAAVACALPRLEKLTLPFVQTNYRGRPLPAIQSPSITHYDCSMVVGGHELGLHLAASLPGLPALRILDMKQSDELENWGYTEPNSFDMGILADVFAQGHLRNLVELHINYRYDEDDDNARRLLQEMGREPRVHALEVLSADGSDLLNDTLHDDLVAALHGGLRDLRVLRLGAHFEAARVKRSLARAFHAGLTELVLSGHQMTEAVRREIVRRVGEGVLSMGNE